MVSKSYGLIKLNWPIQALSTLVRENYLPLLVGLFFQYFYCAFHLQRAFFALTSSSHVFDFAIRSRKPKASLNEKNMKLGLFFQNFYQASTKRKFFSYSIRFDLRVRPFNK